jgi:hypothetical protein
MDKTQATRGRGCAALESNKKYVLLYIVLARSKVRTRTVRKVERGTWART